MIHLTLIIIIKQKHLLYNHTRQLCYKTSAFYMQTLLLTIHYGLMEWLESRAIRDCFFQIEGQNGDIISELTSNMGQNGDIISELT